MQTRRSRRAVSVVAAGVVAIIVVIAVAAVAYSSLSKSSASSTSSATSSTASTVSQSSTSVTSHSFSVPQSSFTTSSSTTAQTFSNSTGNASLANQLVITKVVGDINSSDQQQVLYSLLYNETSFSGGNPSFVGNPGQTFWLQVNLQFNACPCVGVVSSITSATPGFTVTGISPALPEEFGGGGGDYYTAGFWIQVTAPSTPYTGTLTLIDTIE